MRVTMSLSLSQQMAALVEEVVKSGKYQSKSEFFRDLLRDWMERKALKELKKSRKELEEGKGEMLNSLADLR